eukprot:TRINITY_DN15922_c0_g1_i2.p1 TRINITY_DN15922_c0_g1~~TRINITY_DN15922_c0_g1_i2.p1  ORF type:complete len:309 (+),score=108.09 TRINITY_DN15922_c0_g1_i2:181-1107(+)
MDAVQERGLQEVSDTVDAVVDTVATQLDENEAAVSLALDYGERFAVWAEQMYTRHAELLHLLSHVSVVLYGPLFEKTLLASKTFSTVAYPMVKDSLAGIREEYWKVREEKQRHGGVITPWVLLEAVDPAKLEQCAKGFVAGFGACLVGLQAPNVMIFTSGFSIGEYVTDNIQRVLDPLVTRHARTAEQEGRIPVGSAKWFELSVKFACLMIGVYVASIIRRPLVTASSIAESSKALTTAAGARVASLASPTVQLVLQWVITAGGMYHVFVLGGHKHLPAPIRWLLAIPLSVESFLGMASGMSALQIGS